jgi:hypothetical protein
MSMRSKSEQPNDAASVSIATTTSIIMMDEEDMNPLRKTLLLLNKLSWTTIDKLTLRLFAILEEDVPKLTPPVPAAISNPVDNNNNNDNNTETKQPAQPDVLPMVMTILTMIVEKSQTEPHFSAMYAQLCKNLAERNAAWKRKILAHCQSEFEHDTAWHIAKLDERIAARVAKDTATNTDGGGPMEDVSSFTNSTEDMDRDYLVLQLRKKYLGHVQFLGELFKLQLIKLDILIWCLSRLLFSKEQADEDDLECFAKLMTVVGGQAESLVQKGKCHAMAEEKWYQCWDHVYLLTGKPKKHKQSANKPVADHGDDAKKVAPKISSRIKFMLVDLLELQENGTLDCELRELSFLELLLFTLTIAFLYSFISLCPQGGYSVARTKNQKQLRRFTSKCGMKRPRLCAEATATTGVRRIPLGAIAAVSAAMTTIPRVLPTPPNHKNNRRG